jgi:hypothetical protein
LDKKEVMKNTLPTILGVFTILSIGIAIGALAVVLFLSIGAKPTKVTIGTVDLEVPTGTSESQRLSTRVNPIPIPPDYTPPPPTDTPVPTDTPLPPSPTPDPRLFWDDFNQGAKADWQLDYGKWQMVNERLKITEGIDSSAAINVGSLDWRDYAVDLDAGSFGHDWGAGNDSSITVYVRAQDRRNGMWFHITHYRVSCGVVTNGTSKTINEIVEQGVGGGDRHLRIEALGNKYQFWVGDRRVCFFEDDTYSQGRVGLWGRIGWDGAPWIDNFTVSPLP